jgi:hypothetical protein
MERTSSRKRFNNLKEAVAYFLLPAIALNDKENSNLDGFKSRIIPATEMPNSKSINVAIVFNVATTLNVSTIFNVATIFKYEAKVHQVPYVPWQSVESWNYFCRDG